MLNEVVLISCLLPSIAFSFPAFSPGSISRTDSTEACIEKCVTEFKPHPVCGSDHRMYHNMCALNCAKRENKHLTPTLQQCGEFENKFAVMQDKVILKRSVPNDDDPMISFLNSVLKKSKEEEYLNDDQLIPNRFEYAIDNSESGQIENSFKSNENIAEKVWTVLYALRKANKQLILAKNARKTVINELDNIAMSLTAMDLKNFYNVAASDKIDEVQTTPMDANKNHVLRYGNNSEETIVEESLSTTPEYITTKMYEASRDNLENSEETREEKSFISTYGHDSAIHQSAESNLSEIVHNESKNEDTDRGITEHETANGENVEAKEDNSNTVNQDGIVSASKNDETKKENNDYPIDESETQDVLTLSLSNSKENHGSEEQNNNETKDEIETETPNTSFITDSVEKKLDETQKENNQDSNENSTEKSDIHSNESSSSHLNETHEREAVNDDETDAQNKSKFNPSGNGEEENHNNIDGSNTSDSETTTLASTSESDSSETVAVSDPDTSSMKTSGSDEAQADDSHNSEQTTVESEHDESSPSDTKLNSGVSSETSNEALVTTEPSVEEKDANDITVEESDSTTITPEEENDKNQITNERSVESAKTIATLAPVDSSDMQSSDSKSVQQYSFEEPSAPFLSIPLNTILIPHPVSEDSFSLFNFHPGPVDTVYDGDDSSRVSNSYEYGP